MEYFAVQEKLGRTVFMVAADETIEKLMKGEKLSRKLELVRGIFNLGGN